jgi:type II secretory pathway component PulF
MNADDLITLNQEIAGMARAGLPLDRGLATLAKEMGRGKLRTVTQALADDLRAGYTLPEAFGRQAGKIPPFYAGLVAAGARTGRISDVLATLTNYARTLTNVRRIIIDALFYPIVVLIIAFIMFGLLCYFILPQFDQIFREFGIKLPAATQWAITIGTHPLRYLAFPILWVLFGILLARVTLGLSGKGPVLWARFVYAIPIIGTLIRAARMAAFTDLLAILIDYKLPLAEAFHLAGAASSEPIMAATAQQVHEALAQGMPLGEVLRGRGLVSEWVAWMAGLGERNGTLGETLHQVAEMYRRQVELRAGLLRSILPPFLVISTAGVFLLFFVLTVMLPMYKLLGGLAG